jgi:hypothetical protein
MELGVEGVPLRLEHAVDQAVEGGRALHYDGLHAVLQSGSVQPP